MHIINTNDVHELALIETNGAIYVTMAADVFCRANLANLLWARQTKQPLVLHGVFGREYTLSPEQTDCVQLWYKALSQSTDRYVEYFKMLVADVLRLSRQRRRDGVEA